MTLAPEYSIATFNAVGTGQLVQTASLPLDTRTTALKFASALPGGYSNASIGVSDSLPPGVRRPWLIQDLTLPDFAHAEIWYRGGKCWEGRASMPEYVGGVLRSVELQGYGLWATTDAVLIYPSVAQTTGEGLFLLAIGNAGPVSFSLGGGANLQPPAIETNLSQLSGQTPAQVIEQLSKAGDGAQFLWDFTSWNDRQVSFLPRQCPKDSAGNWTPDYYLDWGDPALTVKFDYTNCYGSVFVTYTPPGGSETTIGPFTEPTFTSRFGFSREGHIAVGTTTTAIAAAIGQVDVYQHAWPLLRATYTLGPGQGLPTWPTGSPRPAAFVRAGEWVGLEGQDYPPQVIVRCEVDAMAQTATLELGNPAAGTPQLFAALRTGMEKLKQSIHPYSGAPLG